MKECYKPKTSDEIQKASEEYIWKTPIECINAQDHFIAGAEWMREEMIEKAAEWLYVYYPTLERSKSFEDAWKHFKQAMQDERKDI